MNQINMLNKLTPSSKKIINISTNNNNLQQHQSRTVNYIVADTDATTHFSEDNNLVHIAIPVQNIKKAIHGKKVLFPNNVTR